MPFRTFMAVASSRLKLAVANSSARGACLAAGNISAANRGSFANDLVADAAQGGSSVDVTSVVKIGSSSGASERAARRTASICPTVSFGIVPTLIGRGNSSGAALTIAPVPVA